MIHKKIIGDDGSEFTFFRDYNDTRTRDEFIKENISELNRLFEKCGPIFYPGGGDITIQERYDTFSLKIMNECYNEFQLQN